MSRRSAVTRQSCAACAASVRTSAATPICKSCLDLAEQIFRRTHSPLDADWLPARNRFFGKGEHIVAAVVAERAGQAA